MPGRNVCIGRCAMVRKLRARGRRAEEQEGSRSRSHLGERGHEKEEDAEGTRIATRARWRVLGPEERSCRARTISRGRECGWDRK